MSALSRSSPAHAAGLHRPRSAAYRISWRPDSWIDLLQECFEIGKALAPEHAIMADPVDQRRQPLGLRPVINLTALGTLGDEACEFQRFEMLRDGPLRHPAAAGQLDHRDLVGSDDAFEHGPARRV